jgi:hypothetical protein
MPDSSTGDTAGRMGEVMRSRVMDRWFYAFMALLIFVTALIGFVPSSLGKIAMVQAGQRAPFPVTLHFHAVVMGAWVSLLLVQAFLMASGRAALHRTLGMASFVMIPAVTLVMILITRTTWINVAALPPEDYDPAALAATKTFLANILLGQLQTVVLFPFFAGWAIAVRNTDSEAHKRLLLLATIFPLLAAIDRATAQWHLTTLPASMDSLYLCLLIWLSPGLIYDLVRRGRVHRVYVIGLSIFLLCFIATHYLWSTPFWQATAPKIMRVLGVTGW